MKKVTKTFSIIFLLALLATFGGVSLIQGSIETAQETALTFIEDVLPIDSSQYEITLSNYGVPKLPDLGAFKQNDANQEVLTYSLESKDSTVNVICTLYEGSVYICQAGARKGTVIADKTYANTADAAKSFLEKYQTYSNLDSTEMIPMLTNVDPTKNTTVTSGNLKLTVTHQDLTGTAFGDMIGFRWVRTINGCEYLLTEVAFSDGAFSSFIDHRVRYSIGDTTVNISKEQAIETAMEYIKTYSYQMSGDYWISGFNITEEKTVANLIPTVREGNVLYPHWSVTLYLNQTYPGSVTSLLLGIWADTGEVFFCHHQAYGGSDLTPSNSGDTISGASSDQDPTSPPQLSAATNDTPINLGIVAVLSVAMIAIVATAITLIAKKRSNRPFTPLFSKCSEHSVECKCSSTRISHHGCCKLQLANMGTKLTRVPSATTLFSFTLISNYVS
jgi:hypothetical protein